ncbi:hypothetical protein OH76DRAFT_1011637 [Lentinus brumalis]|uniref:Uncharacterized protein n=1 Tax=Lentinus brumalis TaxID=2498619 RepID=A0A371CYC9_9APHY|nr:hypothetical protein OH76DRAFT_1011637 [Polyporus brumalis]
MSHAKEVNFRYGTSKTVAEAAVYDKTSTGSETHWFTLANRGHTIMGKPITETVSGTPIRVEGTEITIERRRMQFQKAESTQTNHKWVGMFDKLEYLWQYRSGYMGREVQIYRCSQGTDWAHATLYATLALVGTGAQLKFLWPPPRGTPEVVYLTAAAIAVLRELEGIAA